MADLFNHGSYIFGNFVQYKPASVMAGDGNVVEVVQKVFPASLQIPVRGVQVSAEVPRQVLQVLGPQDARAEVLQLYSEVSHAARVLDAVQQLVHSGLPAVANGVSHDAVRAVSHVVQDRSLGQSFVFQRFMMKKPRSGFVHLLSGSLRNLTRKFHFSSHPQPNRPFQCLLCQVLFAREWH